MKHFFLLPSCRKFPGTERRIRQIMCHEDDSTEEKTTLRRACGAMPVVRRTIGVRNSRSGEGLSETGGTNRARDCGRLRGRAAVLVFFRRPCLADLPLAFVPSPLCPAGFRTVCRAGLSLPRVSLCGVFRRLRGNAADVFGLALRAGT